MYSTTMDSQEAGGKQLQKSKPKHKKQSMFQRDLVAAFTKLKWRASFMQTKMKTRVFASHALEMFKAGHSMAEIVETFAHQWWEKQSSKPLDKAFHSIGLKTTTANHLGDIRCIKCDYLSQKLLFFEEQEATLSRFRIFTMFLSNTST
jgi:hypothetical protein